MVQEEALFGGLSIDEITSFQVGIGVSVLLLILAWYYLFWKPFDWCQVCVLNVENLIGINWLVTLLRVHVIC